MNGGHYTAMSKVEDVILTDVLRQRCDGTSGGSSGSGGKGGSKSGGDSVCYDDVDTVVDNSNTATKLSINEFISTTTNTTSTANTAGSSANTSTSSATSRWLKFDDEFVNVVPPANLHTSVVTGGSKCVFMSLYFLRWNCKSFSAISIR